MTTDLVPDHIFAYGSLMWRPGFDFDRRFKATVAGYERRFWQASHDHRGTPESPGRVVTLVPVPEGRCTGLVYLLPGHARSKILRDLDFREKDGYQRQLLSLVCEDKAELQALTWVASEDNPSWRGDESLDTAADLIAHRQGPSGTNADYLFNLSRTLSDYAIGDSHVEALTSAVSKLVTR